MMVFVWLKKIFRNKFFLVLMTSIVIVLVVIYFSGFIKLNNSQPVSSNKTSKPVVAIPVNYTNFAKEISKNYVINALPADALVSLKFYNFTNSERQWERSYVITKSSVKEGVVDNPDLTLTLSSKYLADLTNTNFCTIIQRANKNGDLGIEMDKSAIGLAWQYKSVMKYKSCFGL